MGVSVCVCLVWGRPRAQALQALVEVLKDMPDESPSAQPALDKIFHIVLMPAGPELFSGCALTCPVCTTHTPVCPLVCVPCLSVPICL